MSSDESIDKNRKYRGSIRTSVTKIIKKIDEELANEVVNVESLQESLAVLIEREQKLLKIDDIIVFQCPEKELETEVETSLEYGESIVRCRSRVNRYLKHSAKAKTETTVPVEEIFETKTNSNTKLPRITLEKFNGDIAKYQEFWPQFAAAIHDNETLKDIEKFNYLKSLLCDSAAKAISGLPLTEENYKKAIQILQNRFGKRDLLISTHMNKLLSLEPVQRSSDFSRLRNLYDEITFQIRSLETLKVDFNTYGNLLLPILFKCIPNDLVLNFHRQNTNSETSVTDLLSFIEKEVEAREKSLCVNLNKLRVSKEEEKTFGNYSKRYTQNTPKISSAATLNTTVNKNVCDFCDKPHSSKSCNLSIEEKYNSLYNQFKCKRCLKKGHKRVFCKAKIKCNKCQSRAHLEYLCDRAAETTEPSRQSEIKTNIVQETQVSSLFPNRVQNKNVEKGSIYYQTVRAEIITDSSKYSVRIILDSASERSYIVTSLAQQAGLKTTGIENLKIFTFASAKPRTSQVKRKEIVLKDCHTENYLNIEALETEFICATTIAAPAPEVIHALAGEGIKLSDSGASSEAISILIGNDYINAVMTGKTRRLSDYLMLYETIFGWVLNGRGGLGFNDSCLGNNSAGLFIQTQSVDEENLSVQLRAMWELESLGVTNSPSERSECDKQVIQQFEKDLRFNNGRYETRLLWKKNPDTLGNNFELAKRQFERVRKELKKDTFVREQFEEIIKYQRENNIIQECYERENGYFMPFRAVVRTDKQSTQVRMVFNCGSCTKGNLSLNDCLEQGPNLNPNVMDVILAFRKFKVGFCGDIEKAFLMIGIAEEDRKYLKFLWYSDDDSEEFKIVQMNRVVFGCNCSPFLLSATIKYHIEKYSETNKGCFEMLNSSLYADDLCYGANSVNLALSLTTEAVSILSDASFNLRKLHTNSKELKDLWIKKGLCEENSFERDSKLKVLGLVWSLEEDVLRVDVTPLLNSLSCLRNTKRSVLSTAAKVFDPVGFISPFVVRIKRLMQEIWERGIDWDSELPEDLQKKWEKWCTEIKELGEVKVERYYFAERVGESDSVEIHIFCDSSTIAYGAVAYFRSENKEGEVTTSFIMSKSRIAPLKKLSLPRLELMGALIAARLWKHLSKVFKGLVDRVFLWTDSEICLCWIKGSAREWKQFVSNRVLEIQDCTSPDKWNYCPGLENPADKLTRGESVHTLVKDNAWWRGPAWLRCTKDQWPQQKFKTVADDKKLERLKTVVHANFPVTEAVLDDSKFSSLGKLLRVTAWVIRFVSKLKKKTVERGPLTVLEIQEAEEYWVKRVQSDSYFSEIQLLEKNKPVPPHSKLYSLAPYIDERGILRVRGRLEQAELLHDEKHPIILPKSKFVDLVVMKEHVKSFHSGVSSTLCRVRNKFWIPKGRQIVKRLINTCLVCKKYALKPAKQITGQLPRDRVVESAPFTVVGVDFTGAITVRSEGGAYKKVYIVLFTCAVTRAVHLEVTSNMSAKAFILSLRRFLARRGSCKIIYSDNAKGFRSSCEIIKGFKKVIVDPVVREFVTSEGVVWKFIPERSPWWGGFWERLMRSIKEPLKKILGKALITVEELTTILTEIECVLNNRPLTYDTNELGEPRPLTPLQFLLPGRDSTNLPQHFSEVFNRVSDKETLNRRKLYQTRLLKQIWTKWKEHYLLQLRNAHHFGNPSTERNLKTGDVVLVEGPKKSKLLWDVGVVEEVITGRDGHVRACIVRTSKGHFRRAVQLLYPFEI